MKARTLTAALLLTVAASLSVPAMASISTGKLSQDVQSAVDSGNVNVYLKDGVATLTGNVGSAMGAYKVRQAALAFDGVNQVVDLTSHD